MPANFTKRQLDFYRELYAPFREDELSTKPGRGNKEFTWLDKRALMNRLDTVCGPHGWYPEYRQFGPGLICALTIFCPDATVDGFARITKEDGAGPEEMSEVDNDIKSNFTNALRRSAQDAWGIGRYLYGKGIAGFLDPNATAAPKVQAHTDPGNQPSTPDARAPVSQSPERQAASISQEIPRGGMQLPRSGSGVWGWAKEIEKIFETSIINGLIDTGDRMGFGKVTKNWTSEQTEILCLDAISFLKKLPNYKGQFDWVVTPDAAAGSSPAPEPAAMPIADEASYKASLAASKRQLMNSMQALVEKQIGRKAEPVELKAALDKISPLVRNEHNHTGEVCTSLKDCDDAAWVQNMTHFVMKQIETAVANPPDDEIPF